MLFFMMRIGAIPLKFIEPSCKIDVNLLVSRHENLYSRREKGTKSLSVEKYLQIRVEKLTS